MFHGTTIEEIYKELCSRVQQTKSFSHIEFDNEEYKLLHQKAQSISRSHNQLRQRSARHVFLAFACEYVRRNVYLKDYKFWRDFLIELNFTSKEEYDSFIADELLWPTYSETGIHMLGKGRRQIVDSLVTAIPAISKVTRMQFVNFFCWFYQHHNAAEVSSETLRLYKQKRKQDFPITGKAISRLSDDCRMLVNVLDYVVQQEITLTSDNISSHQGKIAQALQGRCHTLRLELLLADEEIVSSVLLRLQNHYTPEKFLEELSNHPGKRVQTPYQASFACHVAQRTWKAKTLIYGCYWIGNTPYRVVPFPWLWLETIEQWPYQEVVKLRREGYIAYKKSKLFQVKIGNKAVDTCECVLEDDTKCYIWAAKITHGEPLIIDGHLCKEAEGLDWKYSLELNFNQEGEARITVVLDWLKAFYPKAAGKHLFVRTSQEHSETRLLQLPSGICQLHRAIHFPLAKLKKPLVISVYKEKSLLDSKTIQPKTAYLFSAQTRKLIPDTTGREWGERYYYLFAPQNEQVTCSETLEKEVLHTSFKPYVVYKIEWHDQSKPFILQVGSLLWKFVRPAYFYIKIKQQQIKNSVRLTGEQLYQFNQEQLQTFTNLEMHSLYVTCQLFHEGKQIEIQGVLQQASDGNYVFSKEMIGRLNDETIKKHLYGLWDMFVYQDEQLVGSTTIALIPEVTILSPDADQLLPENKTALIHVLSPHLNVWDIAKKQASNSIHLPFRPKTTTQLWRENQQAFPGILQIEAQEVAIPLTFPTIGQTVEIYLQPIIFGFRLYQKQGIQKKAPYQGIEEFDYYTLDHSLLYVFTRPNSTVDVYSGEKKVFSRQADSNGNLLFTETLLLKKNCKAERTEFCLVNEGLKSTFVVRWTPYIHQINVKENRANLTLNGPQGTGLILHFVDVNNQVLSETRTACRGTPFAVSWDIPALATSEQVCYIIPVYRLSSGDLLQSTQQYRLNTQRRYNIPLDWLKAGIGFSDKTLSEFVTWSKR